MQHHGKDPTDLEAADLAVGFRSGRVHPDASGVASKEQLIAWRSELDDWARENGFGRKMTRSQQLNWDVGLGTKLLEDSRHLPERLHPDVWCWISVYLLPHLVVHRWGWPKSDITDEAPTGSVKWARFGQSPRNALRLAMRRVETFGDEIARRADQEEFQFIENRPAFGLDRRVARAILEVLIEARDDANSEYGKGGTRIDANNVGIELRIINSMRPLCLCTNAEIRQVVQSVVERLPDLRARRTRVPED